MLMLTPSSSVPRTVIVQLSMTTVFFENLFQLSFHFRWYANYFFFYDSRLCKGRGPLLGLVAVTGQASAGILYRTGLICHLRVKTFLICRRSCSVALISIWQRSIETVQFRCFTRLIASLNWISVYTKLNNSFQYKEPSREWSCPTFNYRSVCACVDCTLMKGFKGQVAKEVINHNLSISLNISIQVSIFIQFDRINQSEQLHWIGSQHYGSCERIRIVIRSFLQP